ncbi:MAG: hypothetical protein OCD02_04385 [Spirochaetaceae bacterium]
MALIYIENEIFKKSSYFKDKWALLIEFKTNCLATMDMTLQLTDYVNKCKLNGKIQEATAIVVNKDVVGSFFASRRYRPIYEYVNIPFKSFSNIKEAEFWLVDKLKINNEL